MKKSFVMVMTLAVLAVARTGAANADPIADFYRGKTVRMIIGYGVGGGYDLYARIAAEFLGRHKSWGTQPSTVHLC